MSNGKRIVVTGGAGFIGSNPRSNLEGGLGETIDFFENRWGSSIGELVQGDSAHRTLE